jgi:hypothetical protein
MDPWIFVAQDCCQLHTCSNCGNIICSTHTYIPVQGKQKFQRTCARSVRHCDGSGEVPY